MLDAVNVILDAGSIAASWKHSFITRSPNTIPKGKRVTSKPFNSAGDHPRHRDYRPARAHGVREDWPLAEWRSVRVPEKATRVTASRLFFFFFDNVLRSIGWRTYLLGHGRAIEMFIRSVARQTH